MRARRPDTFTRRSLVTVFVLQALLAWLVSVPLLAATAIDGGPLGLLDGVAVLPVEWWDQKWIDDNITPKLEGRSGQEIAEAQQPAKATRKGAAKKRR
jgi:hypothetical protein